MAPSANKSTLSCLLMAFRLDAVARLIALRKWRQRSYMRSNHLQEVIAARELSISHELWARFTHKKSILLLA